MLLSCRKEGTKLMSRGLLSSTMNSEELASTLTLKDLAEHFRRTEGAIRSRIKKLGIFKEEEKVARKWKTRSSNLFHIDLDIVEKTLADANAPLLNKAEEMLDEAGRFSDNLTSLEDAERLKVFIKTLRSQTQEVSNDGSLTDARSQMRLDL